MQDIVRSSDGNSNSTWRVGGGKRWLSGCGLLLFWLVWLFETGTLWWDFFPSSSCCLIEIYYAEYFWQFRCDFVVVQFPNKRRKTIQRTKETREWIVQVKGSILIDVKEEREEQRKVYYYHHNWCIHRRLLPICKWKFGAIYFGERPADRPSFSSVWFGIELEGQADRRTDWMSICF